MITGNEDIQKTEGVTAADVGSEFLPRNLAKEMENGNIAAGPSSVNKFARIVALLFVNFSSLTPAGIFVISSLTPLNYIL